MDDKAMDAGVKPGGLRSKSEIKILICYIMKALNRAFSKEQLCDIIIGESLANYFETASAFNDLINQEHVIIDKTIDGIDYYALTKSGIEVSTLLDSALAYSVKDQAVKSATRLVAKFYNEAENRVTITKCSEGYMVKLAISGTTVDLLTVELFVADSLQANSVKKEFLANPGKFYMVIASLLTDDNKALNDLICQ